MSSHIQLVEDGKVIGLNGRSWSPSPINAWTGFPFEIHKHMRKGEVARRYNPNPLVFLRYRTHGQSRIVSSHRTYDLTVAPQQIDVFPAGFQMDHGWWDCSPGELISIELRPSPLRELMPGAARPIALRPTLSGSDPSLAWLVECMRAEVDRGCSSGRLFADGLSLALLGYLQAHYTDAEQEQPRRPRLSKHDRSGIAEFIEAHLGHDLRVPDLAARVDLSPHHFIRAFRHAFGETPHRYVLRRRVEAAQRMLKSDAPLAQIAYTLGFANQAHFTQVFRRLAGITPARARAEAAD